MISKTRLKIRIRRKFNPSIIELVRLTSKSSSWDKITKVLAGPTRQYPSFNLNQIDAKVSAGDTLIIPGKVLSQGDLTKKIKICALSISKTAREKLKISKSEFTPLIEEVKKNQKAEGVKILS